MGVFMKEIFKVSSLVKEYGKGGGKVTALSNVDLNINEGGLIAITGASGSGKSTLLHILGAMDKPTSGEVCFYGKDISKFSVKEAAAYRCQNVGFVFQNFKLVEELDVKENILLPVMIAKKKADVEYYNTLIEMTGLKERQTHLPSELSGGQKQRAAIARALINKPDVIMADEPTGNLDQATSMEIMQIFTEIHKQGKTIIIVTHDANIAGQCQHEIKISDSRII